MDQLTILRAINYNKYRNTDTETRKTAVIECKSGEILKMITQEIF